MKLNLLVKPVAEVSIGTSIIYLFPASISDVNEFSDMYDEVDAIKKFRKFLPYIASLSVPKDFRDKRVPLSDEVIEHMTAMELEELANAYSAIPSLDKVRAGNADENIAPITRHRDEPATSYLDRLLTAEAERHRRIFEKINAAAASPPREE